MDSNLFVLIGVWLFLAALGHVAGWNIISPATAIAETLRFFLDFLGWLFSPFNFFGGDSLKVIVQRPS